MSPQGGCPRGLGCTQVRSSGADNRGARSPGHSQALPGPPISPAAPALPRGTGLGSAFLCMEGQRAETTGRGWRGDCAGRRGGEASRGGKRGASPVRGPGPPASGSSSSARAASPGMAWRCARPSVPVRPYVRPAEPARPPPLARGMGVSVDDVRAAPPASAQSERAQGRHALRSARGRLPPHRTVRPPSRGAWHGLSRSTPHPLKGKGIRSQWRLGRPQGGIAS